MTKSALASFAIAAAFPGLAAAAERQSKEAFRWSGKAPGLFVRNLNGPITVEAAPAGGPIEVVGTVSWKDSAPEEIRFEVKASDQGVTVCALWPSTRASCGPNGESRHENTRKNDLSVSLRVRLPAGTRLDVAAVNGDVEINADPAAVVARSVNGTVTVSAGAAPLDLGTVNGSIAATVTGAPKGDLSFETVNGSIRVDVPDGLDAEASASTVSGSVTIAGQRLGRAGHTTLGRGGRKLELSSVTGAIVVD